MATGVVEDAQPLFCAKCDTNVGYVAYAACPAEGDAASEVLLLSSIPTGACPECAQEVVFDASEVKAAILRHLADEERAAYERHADAVGPQGRSFRPFRTVWR